MANPKPKIPQEILAAADLALDQGMLPKAAQDMFRYALLSRGVERYGNQTEAAKKFGMLKQQLSQSLAALEARL